MTLSIPPKTIETEQERADAPLATPDDWTLEDWQYTEPTPVPRRAPLVLDDWQEFDNDWFFDIAGRGDDGLETGGCSDGRDL